MQEIRVKCHDRYEPDNWTTNGFKVTSEQGITAIQEALNRGPIIVQHWFYRGASSPFVLAVEVMDEFVTYVKTKTSAGDILQVWSFPEVCTKDNVVVQGKVPDLDGATPEGGAY
ncbi:MAG: hypothetical protein HY565_03435 [Candidatus Kerfeldbacteria bacterium]|nr:hypothetical protein [Candidatus Kerfeldbacteria bacterium]